MTTLAATCPRARTTRLDRSLLALAETLTAYVEHCRVRRLDAAVRTIARSQAADAQRDRAAQVHLGMLPR